MEIIQLLKRHSLILTSLAVLPSTPLFLYSTQMLASPKHKTITSIKDHFIPQGWDAHLFILFNQNQVLPSKLSQESPIKTGLPFLSIPTWSCLWAAFILCHRFQLAWLMCYIERFKVIFINTVPTMLFTGNYHLIWTSSENFLLKIFKPLHSSVRILKFIALQILFLFLFVFSPLAKKLEVKSLSSALALF